jgi:competence protein ComEC
VKKRLFPILLIITLACSAAVFAENGGDKPPVIASGDLTIHFLELGNKYTGDCVYINYGDSDIIIDAGSRQSSAVTIKAYIDNFITDNKIEYVIATHAHRDHIAGFYSTNNATGILDAYEIGTIIDFPKTNRTTVVYRNYINTRNRLTENGTVHYTALQCYNNEDGARRVFDFGDGVKLEILYNYYYENPAGNENNYSVCARIIHNDKQFIFTGDLEIDGEEKLAEYYEEHYGGLGHCVLYKGGHHGSNTSSSEKLMAAITPEYVCVCSCVGTAEYRALPSNGFPSQGFVDRIAPYTDKIYITTLITDYPNNQFMPFNGNIVFLVSGGAVSVTCSGNDHILKNSDWFLANRQMPDAWKTDMSNKRDEGPGGSLTEADAQPQRKTPAVDGGENLAGEEFVYRKPNPYIQTCEKSFVYGKIKAHTGYRQKPAGFAPHIFTYRICL